MRLAFVKVNKRRGRRWGVDGSLPKEVFLAIGTVKEVFPAIGTVKEVF